MKEIFLIIFLFVAGCSGEIKAGLRALVFYTYDDSFADSDINVQKLDVNLFDKLMKSNEFISSPNVITNSNEFLSLLDGHCDIQLKCEKFNTLPSNKYLPSIIECPPPNCDGCRTTVTTSSTTTESSTLTKTKPTTSITQTESRTPITTRHSTDGPPYLPPSTQKYITHAPWTGTYQPYTGSFNFTWGTHTWRPEPYTGTWRTTRNVTRRITTTGRYVNPYVKNIFNETSD